MYDADHIGEVKSLDPIEALSRRKNKARDKIVRSWQKQRSTTAADSALDRFLPDFVAENNLSVPLLKLVKEKRLKGGYARAILMDDIFHKFSLASVYTLVCSNLISTKCVKG